MINNSTDEIPVQFGPIRSLISRSLDLLVCVCVCVKIWWSVVLHCIINVLIPSNNRPMQNHISKMVWRRSVGVFKFGIEYESRQFIQKPNTKGFDKHKYTL